MPRVLVIDDDIETCRVITEILEGLGCTADIANDGREGLERYQGGQYALVISDLFLPEVMGYDVCREIRASGRGTPIIATSGVCRSAEDAADLGVPVYGDAFIAKPIDIDDLAAKIQTLLFAESAPTNLPAVFRDKGAEPADEVRAAWVGRLARELVEVFVRRASGRLHLRRADYTLDVVCAHGFPVDVVAPFHKENLGLFLVREGRMTDAEYQQALHAAVGRRSTLEQALVEVGIVDAAELAPLTRAHRREALVAAFAWREGEVDMETGEPPTASGFQVNPSTVVLDGIARAFQDDDSKRHYEALAARLVHPGPNFERYLPLFAPFLYCTGLHSALGAGQPVATLLEGEPSLVAQNMRLLRALHLLEVLVLEEPGAARSPAPPLQVPAAIAASMPRRDEPPRAPPPLPVGFELGVPPDEELEDDAPAPVTPAASMAAMAAAALAAAGIEEPKPPTRPMPTEAPRFSDRAAAQESPASVAAERLERERTIMRDLANLRDADHYRVLGVARDVGGDELREAFSRLAERCTAHGFSPAGVEAAQELLARAALAFGALGDRELRMVYNARLTGQTLATFAATLLRRESPPSRPTQPAPKTNEEIADGLLRDGKAALDKGDAAAALRAFEEVVRRRGEFAPGHLYMGLSRYRTNPRDPTTIQAAVHEIMHAAELEESDVPYFHLGMIFKEQGLAHKARQMLGRAVSLNPKNEEARRALEALGGVAA